jgi:hypothetical protein
MLGLVFCLRILYIENILTARMQAAHRCGVQGKIRAITRPESQTRNMLERLRIGFMGMRPM